MHGTTREVAEPVADARVMQFLAKRRAIRLETFVRSARRHAMACCRKAKCHAAWSHPRGVAGPGEEGRERERRVPLVSC